MPPNAQGSDAAREPCGRRGPCTTRSGAPPARTGRGVLLPSAPVTPSMGTVAPLSLALLKLWLVRAAHCQSGRCRACAAGTGGVAALPWRAADAETVLLGSERSEA